MLPRRKLMTYAARLLVTDRSMSSSAMVDVQDDAGIAIMTLQRAPVNILNLDMLQAISQSLDDVAKNKPRGMILTSASSTVFSAGLDIREVYKPDLKKLEQFSTTLQDVWIKLFGFPFATAAAINGHAPAGGCLLAMSCEYRVMVKGKYTIGLNETVIGMVAKEWFMDTLLHTISTRNAELALTTGKLFTVDEALKIGMIDETAHDKIDAIDKCKNFIKRFDNITPYVRTKTKLRIRNRLLEKMEVIRKQEIIEDIAFIQRPEVQLELHKYMQSLKKKTAK